MNGPTCPLCIATDSRQIFQRKDGARYYLCCVCDLRFLDPAYRLATTEEHQHYLSHNNNVEEAGYQEFIRPLIDAVCERTQSGAIGLDFGSGPGPIVSHMLKQRGFTVNAYDPFFAPDRSVLAIKYDFVASSEVVEHFFDPNTEFKNLRSLLKPSGLLALMTQLYEPRINFAEWYYMRDLTHVVFYSAQTFEWIAKHFNFTHLEILGPRVILLRASGEND